MPRPSLLLLLLALLALRLQPLEMVAKLHKASFDFAECPRQVPARKHTLQPLSGISTTTPSRRLLLPVLTTSTTLQRRAREDFGTTHRNCVKPRQAGARCTIVRQHFSSCSTPSLWNRGGFHCPNRLKETRSDNTEGGFGREGGWE